MTSTSSFAASREMAWILSEKPPDAPATWTGRLCVLPLLAPSAAEVDVEGIGAMLTINLCADQEVEFHKTLQLNPL